ncbi:MAG: hypothetical protein RLZZ164_760 [Actinomycetota bacterium]|jgi:16S rRNA (cytosine967-C5)-methyltransferase
MTTARKVAYELLHAVAADDAYANLLLPNLLRQAKLAPRDSGLAQEIAFGTLRLQGRYDAIIEIAANRHIADITLPALLLLRMGCHQLLAMRVGAHAAINETVNLAKQVASHGSAGFVNGCLRRVSERSLGEWLELLEERTSDTFERDAIINSHPTWIVRAFAKALDQDGIADQLDSLLQSDNANPVVNLVALPGLATSADTEQLEPSKSSPIGFLLESGDPAKLDAVAGGRVRVQDAGSQLAALALVAAKPVGAGETWLDMCAGPGGKAALLAAEAVQTKSRLVASELQQHRSDLVRNALEPIDPNVEIVTMDARGWGTEYPAEFDRILLDAPCSGLGALRRRPEARWRKKPKDIGELSALQEQLLTSAWQALKPGGVLAYVTCSPHVGETTSVIEWATRKFGSEFEQLDTPAVFDRIKPGLPLNRKRKAVQLWPQVHDTDAMFIALITKSLG